MQKFRRNFAEFSEALESRHQVQWERGSFRTSYTFEQFFFSKISFSTILFDDQKSRLEFQKRTRIFLIQRCQQNCAGRHFRLTLTYVVGLCALRKHEKSAFISRFQQFWEMFWHARISAQEFEFFYFERWKSWRGEEQRKRDYASSKKVLEVAGKRTLLEDSYST